jgi:two-component system NtrC family sensor kinase
MKTKLFCLFLLLNTNNFCEAQDTTVVLNTSMFDKDLQTIFLTQLNGWIFKQGNDTNWIKTEIDTTGWIKMNPTQFTIKNADKNGRLEGWLRMRFKLNSSFENMRIGIQTWRWAATDVYIDGNYITSYGNTGLNGKPYEENREEFPTIQPLHIETEKEHALAVHIVDYVAPLDNRHLKTESLSNSFASLIALTGPLAAKKTTTFWINAGGYFFLYSGVIGFLSVLFWFLYLQNRREKNLLFISISTSLWFIWPLLLTIAAYPLDLDFNRWWLIAFIAYEWWPLAIASMLYTAGEIFNFKYKKALAIFAILFVIYCVFGFYFSEIDVGDTLIPLVITILLLYIVVSSWKKLKGAQWAVVAGILLTAIFSFLSNYVSGWLYESIWFLSLPASLMIYVAMRFKEILREVQVNAKQVVQLSEEKKEQAVQQQKILEEEVARQTIELRTSLDNLKSTQAQLIQSEKMASLGELTAGIAHEIQNPLNFVNNFADVNTELIAEMKQEIDKGNIEEVKSIAKDIEDNEQKIVHHGKRADSIVKGMLQHSRVSTGQKEMTDINALADEYLRLSYHGMRAKDKSFNATLKTNFDTAIGKINVVPQGIGRVLLNLLNNAFYSVMQKKKELNVPFEPTVAVCTKKVDSKIDIHVKDNGVGIPPNVVDKVFQPFFTTKPTGQGTGLGLSLSYDIIKAHGGEIKVETKDGEGAELIIRLPVK